METAVGQERIDENNRPIAAVTPLANPLRSRREWDAARQGCLNDPGRFHGDIAKREIHWFDPSVESNGGWITYDEERRGWTGFDARTGAAVRASCDAAHEPWTQAFDDRDAPFYRWFSGGRTNACFNEVDRHVLAGHGSEPAVIFEGDRWDQS